jgi:hypothetical protein
MPEDHDLLIRIDEKMDNMETQFSNHLKHHFTVNLCLLAALLANAGAFVLFLLRS